jgi:catechol 2,3-dioxygenase-like lactoylglutathione lyase family enzyme
MLDRFPMNPVLAAKDGDRARAFYRDTLGLTLLSGPEDDPMMFQAGGGSTVVVTEIPDRVPPDYAVVSFLVEDIETLVAELERRGVEFLAPEGSSFQGVAGRIAGHVIDYGTVKSTWFRDSEGNVLAMNEIVA